MLQKFLNLKLKSKLIIGFLTISSLLIIIGLSTYFSLNKLEDKKRDIDACETLKDGVTDIKFVVAHDLKMLMEIITTDNKSDLQQFWNQHQALKVEYDKAYKPLREQLKSMSWGDQFDKSILKIEKDIAFVHEYRTKTLIPSIDNIYALRLKQLSLGTSDASNLVNTKIQNEINVLDDNADGKAEAVFSTINQIEKSTADISNIADNEQLALSTSSKIKNFVMMGVGFALALAIALFLSNYLVNNVHALRDMIESLRKGKLPQKAEIKTKDEIAEITDSLNQLTDGLQNTSSFAQEIGKGNFEQEFQPLSNEDELGNSLINMRSNLIKVAEDEKKRNWATEGLAKFGDILRGNSQSLDELADDIISNLVRYLSANQGGLFILNDVNLNDRHLELIACYAWNKKKYLHMRIEEGEGLVGQCWQENDTLYITDVPTDYVKITSGLGDSNPSAFLIVPLTVNDETFGVVEIASFHLFEKHQIEFVEKLAESIASTLSTAKTNERTKVLLEQSQQQTEEMRAQEEEMRQNMEEMQATQEEMERKEAEMSRMVEQMQQQEEEMRQNMEEMAATQEEMEKQTAIIAETAAENKGTLDGIDATMATIEFSPQGFVIKANENFTQVMGTDLDQIVDKHHSNFVPVEIINSSEYQSFWKDLANGIEKKGVFKRVGANGETVWLNAIYNPIKNANGEVVKIVKFATDITHQKELEAQMKAQMDIINDIAIVSKTDLQGNITYVNDEFVKWAKYSREEIMGKNHRILKSGDQDDQIFADMWKTISSGKIFRGEIKNKAKDGSIYWVDAIIAPILDDLGKPKEYIAQRFVINEQKAKEEQMQYILEETRAQEEEIRQNLEEVQATSEEMERVIREMDAQNSIINSIAIVSKTDLLGNITYVNDQFVKWAKYSKDEAIGQNHRILRHPDMPAEAFEDMWKTISSGQIWRGEVKNLAKDGSVYWVDAIIAPILDGNGKPKEYIAQRFVIQK